MPPIQPFQPTNNLAAGDQQKKQTGTGFTNLNRIMQANQGNQLGKAVGGGVAQQAGQAKESLNQARTGFDTASQANRLDTDQNKQEVNNTLQSVDTGQDVNDQTAQDFSRFRQGQYAGPQTLQNEDQVINQAQNAQNLGGLSSSAAGRQALLQRFVGGNNYSQGKQQLDNLLLGQSGGQDLRDARRQTQNLNQTALQSADAARQQAQYLSNQAQAFGTDVNNRLTGQQNAYDTAVDQQVAATQSQEAQKAALYKQIQDTLGANGARTGAQNLTSSNDAYLANVNKALGLASQNGILGTDDMSKIGQLNDALLTPAQQMLKQTTTSGSNAYLGYGTSNPGSTTVTPGNAIYSNLGLDEVLNNALKVQGAQNVTRTGVADDLNRARTNALSKLAGKTSEYTDADARYKKGGATFDLNQAGNDVNAELARLKGDTEVTLPTISSDPSWQEKIANTMAPSTADFGGQVKQDVNGVIGANQSLGDRAASLGKLYLDPLRGAIGSVAEQGSQLYNQTGEGLNQALGGGSLADRAQGVGTLANTGTGLLSTVANQGANVLGSIPVVGGALAAPSSAAAQGFNALSAPTSFQALVNKPKEAAQAAAAAAQAAASVANSIFNPISWFCYGAGTPIKMKNGSYKDVDKLKLGDDLYYGGKVTAAGQSIEKDIYEYLGTKVTGGHAVFENGKFVRVSASSHAKKVAGSLKVYPIECEKHIIVTKTHLGADFSEIDNGQGMTPETRLEKLNSDPAKLKKLDTASALLFHKKNEN